MAKANRDKVGDALEVLVGGLRPYAERELERAHGSDWKAACESLMKHPPRGETWDTAALVSVMLDQWHAVFRDVLGNAEKNQLFEVRDVRNRWAHEEPFTADDTYRALDTFHRLLLAVGAGAAAVELDDRKNEVMRQKISDQTRHASKKRAMEPTMGRPAAGLKPWRAVVEPHDDVASGNYQQAQFAADLHRVWSKRAQPEYGDPQEFFRRTFLTEGLQGLLRTAIRRLARGEGDPVMALQTNFGGGKTHSMLSLYHLFDPAVKPASLTGMDDLLTGLGLEAGAWPSVKRAVLVGHHLEPASTAVRRSGSEEVEVRTIWGEMAWQLAGAEGYAVVADADRRGVSPGAALSRLFELAGPSLILIDEWVAYARQLYEKHDLPAGGFDAQFSFAQALTEAAAGAKNVMLVVSVPASDIEAGGTAGREALKRLSNVVARTDAAWQPASTEEGFEIVRRRLFKSLDGEEAFKDRDQVIRAFMDNARASPQDFPPEAAEAGYEDRMRLAYPIHPEVFDRLYNDWATLERFQKTRGVLRLMAGVVHHLWERQDGSLLILPGTLPLDDKDVRSELTRYLEPEWSSILDQDVDGAGSVPLTIDQGHPNLGRYSACRRVARTLFLGTAPLTGTGNRGKDVRRVNLGCVQPGEAIPTFGDALRRLQNTATFVVTDGERSFYDTAKNINREAESRKSGFSEDVVAERVREVLLADAKASRGRFARVHVCPQGPSDVVDERETRLVVLPPEATHANGNDGSAAMEAARATLASRGAGARRYRNAIVFVAADQARVGELLDAVRWELAWREIDERQAELNLNENQRQTARAKRKEWAETVRVRVPEAYPWLLVPEQPEPRGEAGWQAIRLPGQDALAERAAKRMLRDESLVAELGGVPLRMHLDGVPLWQGDDVPIRQLVDHFATYLYLPRLTSPEVLLGAVGGGVQLLSWERDTFALAEGKRGSRYTGLVAGAAVSGLTPESTRLLVKPEVAAAQLAAEREEGAGGPGGLGNATTGGGGGGPGTGVTTGAGGGGAAAPPTAPTRFRAEIELEDAARLGRDAATIGKEVLAHLLAHPDARVRVVLEVEAEVPGGAGEQLIRTVTENCRTLGFQHQGFSG